MNRSSSELEQFLDGKITEFNEKRVKALQELTIDEILDFNPISFVLRSKYSMAEIASMLVDRKLMKIEQYLLEDLISDLSGFIESETPLTDSELQTILQRIIHNANIFEGIEGEYARATDMVFMKLFECRDKSRAWNWVKLVNLSSNKFGLEKIMG